MDEFVLDHYETALEEDELVTELGYPQRRASVYRKFRSRSSEDRPCVSVAAAQDNGATGRGRRGRRTAPSTSRRSVTRRGERLSDELATEIGPLRRGVEPLSDSRGSARYRRRVIAVEVRRALEDLHHD